MSDPDLALPRAPGIVRRWLEGHPRLVDAAVVVACQIAPAALILLLAAAIPEDYALEPWTVAGTAGCLAVGAVMLLLRRRRPLLAAIVCGTLAVLPMPFAMGGGIAVFVALYALGVHSTTRRTWLGFAAATAATVVASGVATVVSLVEGTIASELWGDASAPLPNAVMYLVPTLLGLSVGNRRRYIDALVARAADLARERDQRAQLAVADERARIAREMHDIVSHSLTVMITLSEGAAAQAEAGRPSPDAMRTVAETGRSSLAEMRRLLAVLRSPDEGAELAPQPGDADLDVLAERFREAGLPVRLTRSGPAIADGALALTIFRIVQEGLTNVLRHAPGARRVEASVLRGGGRVVVEVVNSAGGRPTAAPGGRGTGIVGLRERAALYAGAVEAGATAEGGWLLRAELADTGEDGT
ncbi:sensor histidine kinase [Microbacterium sp. NPDC055683]